MHLRPTKGDLTDLAEREVRVPLQATASGQPTGSRVEIVGRVRPLLRSKSPLLDFGQVSELELPDRELRVELTKSELLSSIRASVVEPGWAVRVVQSTPPTTVVLIKPPVALPVGRFQATLTLEGNPGLGTPPFVFEHPVFGECVPDVRAEPEMNPLGVRTLGDVVPVHVRLVSRTNRPVKFLGLEPGTPTITAEPHSRPEAPGVVLRLSCETSGSREVVATLAAESGGKKSLVPVRCPVVVRP